MTLTCLHCGTYEVLERDQPVIALKLTHQPGSCHAGITCPRCREEVRREDVHLGDHAPDAPRV